MFKLSHIAAHLLTNQKDSMFRWRNVKERTPDLSFNMPHTIFIPVYWSSTKQNPCTVIATQKLSPLLPTHSLLVTFRHFRCLEDVSVFNWIISGGVDRLDMLSAGDGMISHSSLWLWAPSFIATIAVLINSPTGIHPFHHHSLFCLLFPPPSSFCWWLVNSKSCALPPRGMGW